MRGQTDERNELISIEDMMCILGGCSYSFAARRIREVKHISDRLQISGHIHRLDWEDYLEFCKKKDNAQTFRSGIV